MALKRQRPERLILTTAHRNMDQQILAIINTHFQRWNRAVNPFEGPPSGRTKRELAEQLIEELEPLYEDWGQPDECGRF